MLPRPTDRKSSDNVVVFFEGGGVGGRGGVRSFFNLLNRCRGSSGFFQSKLKFSEVPGGSNICIPGGGGGVKLIPAC